MAALYNAVASSVNWASSTDLSWGDDPSFPNWGEASLANGGTNIVNAGTGNDVIVLSSAKAQQDLVNNGANARFDTVEFDEGDFGTNTADALFAGVPVIALEGGSFAGRVSSALLRAAGMRALVHTEVSAYVEMTVKLLHHPRELARIKQWVRSQAPQSEIFNTASKARQLEGAYAHIYERARQGLPPEHVNIQAQQSDSRA